MTPNKINKYTKRYSISVFFYHKEKQKWAKTQLSFSPHEKRKNIFLTSPCRVSLWLLVDRNSKHHGVLSPRKPFKITLRNRYLPQTSDSVQHQTEMQCTLAQPVPQHSNQILDTGKQVAQQMGTKICQDNWFQGQKEANGRYCESRSSECFITTLPAEKKNNWSESCNCIMFNIHGWAWRTVPTLPLSSPSLMKITP